MGVWFLFYFLNSFICDIVSSNLIEAVAVYPCLTIGPPYPSCMSISTQRIPSYKSSKYLSDLESLVSWFPVKYVLWEE